MKFEISETIDASPERVFDTLGRRFGDVSTWGTGVLLSMWNGDDLDDVVGAVRVCDVAGIGLIHETITRFIPDREVAYRVKGMPVPIDVAESHWRLEPRGEGTEVSVTITLTLRNGMGLMAPMVRRKFGAVGGQVVQDLKAFVESGEPSASKRSGRALAA